MSMPITVIRNALTLLSYGFDFFFKLPICDLRNRSLSLKLKRFQDKLREKREEAGFWPCLTATEEESVMTVMVMTMLGVIRLACTLIPILIHRRPYLVLPNLLSCFHFLHLWPIRRFYPNLIGTQLLGSFSLKCFYKSNSKVRRDGQNWK